MHIIRYRPAPKENVGYSAIRFNFLIRVSVDHRKRIYQKDYHSTEVTYGLISCQKNERL
jgi:hypothetical protein